MTHKKKAPKTAPTPPKNARHLTAERLHDLARKWKRAQSAPWHSSPIRPNTACRPPYLAAMSISPKL